MPAKPSAAAMRLLRQRAANLMITTICGLRIMRASQPTQFTPDVAEDLDTLERLAADASPSRGDDCGACVGCSAGKAARNGKMTSPISATVH